jgi:hypothetical protein
LQSQPARERLQSSSHISRFTYSPLAVPLRAEPCLALCNHELSQLSLEKVLMKMNISRTFFMDGSLRFARRFAFAIATGASFVAAKPASATLITLENFNSVAQFATESTDAAPNKGLYSWQVDGVEHITQQWFWFRAGTTGPEQPIDSLTPVQSVTLDVDGTPGQDALMLRYRDAAATYEVSVRYTLTGGEANSGVASLEEVIRVVNLTDNPLDFSMFQYVDFDLNGTSDDDTVSLSGTPINTALQLDALTEISETVVTPPPSRYEVSEFGSPGGIEARLADGVATSLNNTLGPVTNADATWAFEWDFRLNPRGSYLISKNKSLRGAVAVPEPSSTMLLSIGAVFVLAVSTCVFCRHPA